MTVHETVHERPDYPLIAAAIDDFENRSLASRPARGQPMVPRLVGLSSFWNRRRSIPGRFDRCARRRRAGAFLRLDDQAVRSRATFHHHDVSGRNARILSISRSATTGATGLQFERMRDNLREVVGRIPYRTPRIDQRLPVVVSYVNTIPLPTRVSGAVRRGSSSCAIGP